MILQNGAIALRQTETTASASEGEPIYVMYQSVARQMQQMATATVCD